MLQISRDDHIDDIHIPAQVSLGILTHEKQGYTDIRNSTCRILKEISKQLEDTYHSFKFVSTFHEKEYLEAAEEVLKYESPGTSILEIILNLPKDDLPFDKVPNERSVYKEISEEIKNKVLERLEVLNVDEEFQFKVIVSLTALVKSGITARRIMEIELEKEHDTLKIIDCNYFNEKIDDNLGEFTGLNEFYTKIIENSPANDSKRDNKLREYLVNNSNILILLSNENPYSSSSLLKNPVEYIKIEYKKHWINPKSGCIAKELNDNHIFNYIKRVGKTVFWINPENGEYEKGSGKDNALRSLEHFNIFNKEKLNTSGLEEKIEYYSGKFIENANDSGLPLKYIEPINKYMVPYVAKSSLLAGKYQKWDKWTNDFIYLLSILAVLVVTIQLLFSPTEIFWIILEVIFISIILFILVASRKLDWHRKWIEYRSLSESLRSFPYLFLVEIDCGISNMLPHLSRSHEDWIENAFAYITGQFEVEKTQGSRTLKNEKFFKVEECKLSAHDRKDLFEPLKNFILVSWIKSQRRFYQKSCTKNMRKHKFFYYLSLLIFGLTLLFAVIHGILMYVHSGGGHGLLDNSLILAVIVLPAAGAAVSGLKIQKEYLRNWKRYESMAYHLSKLEDEINEVDDEKRLLALINQANEIMNLEHQDWRITSSFHKVEPP